MKRQSSTPATISNAVLATRYLALQELREKVRKAEERFALTRLNKTSMTPPASVFNTHMRLKDRKS